MTKKHYQVVRLMIVIGLAIFFSQAMFLKNYFIPIGVLVAASLLLIALRRRVKEVLADERDYALGGKAALLAIQVYSWFAVVSMFVLFALRDRNPAYEPIAMTLSYSTCILMLVYAVVYRYYNNFKFSDKKFIYSVVVLILFLILMVVSLRLFSGEDDWVCQNKQWVSHGHPSFAAPQTPCE